MIAVSSKLGDSFITVVENVEYNRSNIKIYEEKFKYYKEKGTIRADDFNDNEWVIVTGIDKNTIYFNFSEPELEFKKAQKKKLFSKEFSLVDLEISIKGYILYQLSEYSSHTIVSFYRRISELLKDGVLSCKEIPERFINNNHILNSAMYCLLRKYFHFIFQFYSNNYLMDDFEDKHYEYIAEKVAQSAAGEDKRALPSMETMFKFNDIINDFIKAADKEYDMEKKKRLQILKKKFFPIILWWKITSIIPLRTTEFCVTPKECTFEIDGVPYLIFRRSVLKGGKKPKDFDHSIEKSYYEDKFPISRELYNLIKEYKDLVKQYDESEDFYGDGRKGAIERKYLLSYRSYKKMSSLCNVIEDDEILNGDILYYLINNFLVEYVINELGLKIIPKSKEFDQQLISEFELNNISLMDTRHYAIMNLHFMGYESSTIQRIIGHNRLDQQLSYFAHAEAFINCYIVSAAKEIAKNQSKQHKKDLLDLTFTEIFGKKGSGNERFQIVKNREIIDKGFEPKMLDEGLCSYENIENDKKPCRLYAGDHGICPFFVGNGKRSLGIVNDAFNDATDEICTELKILADITKNKKQYTGASIEQSNVSKNKIMSLAQIKAQIIADFIFNGVDMEG